MPAFPFHNLSNDEEASGISMIIGNYKILGKNVFPLVEQALAPIPLNPEARYLITPNSLGRAEHFAEETRFGCSVAELLKNQEITELVQANRNPDFDPIHNPEAGKFEKGDMLGVHNFGFVEFMDVMGSDDEIADAARTSYTGGKKARANRGLLRYLMRHQHTTPFEMGELKFRLYIPIFVYRQLFRHRTANQLEPEMADCISNDSAFQTYSVQNEMSGRYVEMPDHYYLPEVSGIEKQSLDNKQGRSQGAFDPSEQAQIQKRLKIEVEQMREWYRTSLEQGVAKELSRANLPLSQYTLLIWKINLKNLLHFIALRLHPHAQYEVREYAWALYAIAHSCFPVATEAFDDYALHAQRFTREELHALQLHLSSEQKAAIFKAFQEKVSNSREQAEFALKLGLEL